MKLINTPAGVQEEQQGELLTAAALLLVVLLSSLDWNYCNVERLNWPVAGSVLSFVVVYEIHEKNGFFFFFCIVSSSETNCSCRRQ